MPLNDSDSAHIVYGTRKQSGGRVRKSFVKEWDVCLIWDDMELLQADQQDVDRLSIILVS